MLGGQTVKNLRANLSPIKVSTSPRKSWQVDASPRTWVTKRKLITCADLRVRLARVLDRSKHKKCANVAEVHNEIFHTKWRLTVVECVHRVGIVLPNAIARAWLALFVGAVNTAHPGLCSRFLAEEGLDTIPKVGFVCLWTRPAITKILNWKVCVALHVCCLGTPAEWNTRNVSPRRRSEAMCIAAVADVRPMCTDKDEVRR